MSALINEKDRVVREVLKLLPELGKAISRSMPARARHEGVSAAQVKALVHLSEYGPQTMGELAEGLRITTPSATGLINPLVEMGLVERERDTEDRRVVQVQLTKPARKLADEILAKRRAEVEGALADMDAEARAHFLEGLRRLAAVYGGGNGSEASESSV
ncbi:MAG: MarR family transcriptional regulator [Thermoleophilia bacterium]|nr:MarR family transcriptional regulator [Thermoleophilia bacterium]